jgi:hypothetical protein
MARPELPRLVASPMIAKFQTQRSAKNRLAAIARLQALDNEVVGAIEHAVACYLATKEGSETTTTANVLRTLRQFVEGSNRAQRDAIEVLAHDQSGIDSETHRLLSPLAKRVLEGDGAAKALLIQAAKDKLVEVEAHPRVTTSTEPMRHFCGVIRVIFNECTCHPGWVGIDPEEAWRRCGKFALEIFAAAGIDHADFDAHPERLKEYLGTDV